MKKFALLVGNGFTSDFIDTQNIKLHSSFPLKNFKNSDINYSYFIEYLPFIKNELLGQDVEDYTAIENYASKYKIGSFEEGQLRQFLAVSYSLFQLNIDKYDFSNWKWVNWLRENGDYLSCAISFNYDLVLERALTVSGNTYYRTGTNEPYRKIPIMKPHGSIDFDIHDRAINIPIHSRWDTLTFSNDAGFLEIVPKWEWLLPRTEADIIPPSVQNYNEVLSWVKTIPKTYGTKTKELDALVIVGSSYWDVDRPEIDFFLENLPKTATVYISDLKPDKDLIKKIKSLNLSFETFGFNNLPW